MHFHLLLVFTVITHVSASNCTFDLEAERGNSLNQKNRSEASGDLTVRLKESEVLQNSFEITTLCSSCLVGIKNVAYSNDGISDFVQLSLNGTQLGRFRTVAQVGKGNYWNEIISTGAFGNHTQLLVGRYTLMLTVLEANPHGVEIDKVTLAVECTGNTDCPEVEITESTVSGFTLQWPSVPTVSTEQNNGLTVSLIIVGIVSIVVTAVIGLPGCLVYCMVLSKRSSPVDATVMSQ